MSTRTQITETEREYLHLLIELALQRCRGELPELPALTSLGPESRSTKHDAGAQFISDVEVARRTSIQRPTLQAWRAKGEGPPFFRVGRRVLYDWVQVEAWIRSRQVGLSQPSQARRR